MVSLHGYLSALPVVPVGPLVPVVPPEVFPVPGVPLEELSVPGVSVLDLPVPDALLPLEPVPEVLPVFVPEGLQSPRKPADTLGDVAEPVKPPGRTASQSAVLDPEPVIVPVLPELDELEVPTDSVLLRLLEPERVPSPVGEGHDWAMEISEAVKSKTNKPEASLFMRPPVRRKNMKTYRSQGTFHGDRVLSTGLF